jgi:AcrR family transcriptional regulator
LTEESQADKRIQKTLAALRDAFFDLVLSYSYDEIKVSDIIEKAKVGRSTFYQHYKNKDEILARSMSMLFDKLAQSVAAEDNTQDLLWLLDHFWQNRKFAPRVFAGTARRVVIRALAQRLEEAIQQRCKQESVKPFVPSNLVAHQLAEFQMVIIVDWLTGKGNCDIEPMAGYIENTTKAICKEYMVN